MSPTLDLVNDYLRFVIGFFNVIKISALHIYHSALPLSPQESIIHNLYKQYIQPLARVVCGLPISWEPSVATVRHTHRVEQAAWSSCSRFIAVGLPETIEILDAVTLERLHTFKSSNKHQSQWLSFSPDSRSLTQFSDDAGHTTWDLLTGGQIGAIPSSLSGSSSRCLSSAYSMDGKVVAVSYEDLDGTGISTYNLGSGTHIYSHRVSEGQIVAPIWTYGDCLRFVTVKPGSITIWKVGFTLEHALAEIESLPAPDNIDPRGQYLFLPTRTRLAFTLKEAVLVWDAWNSKFLLNFKASDQPMGLSFSSDGRFFTYLIRGGEIHLWKESPTGYVLHRKLAPSIDRDFSAELLLSPNGESIITSDYSTQLWRTTDPITSLPATQLAKRTDFILGFSPGRSLAATARLEDNTATVIDLKSGNPQLIIDTGMEICGLGVTENAVIVVGGGKTVAWDLPTGDCGSDARANIHDSVRTVVFDCPVPPPKRLRSASISPDFDYVITQGSGRDLDLYEMSTGKHLTGITSKHLSIPRFTRDGREVWSYPREGWKIIKDETSDVIGLEPLGSNADPSGGFPWKSSHGHHVTDDGWILDSRKKRVMWLPHRWRILGRDRIWDGRFLGLLDGGLPEPVIIELDE